MSLFANKKPPPKQWHFASSENLSEGQNVERRVCRESLSKGRLVDICRMNSEG